MFSRMQNNRKGAITVMLSLLLIAVMSINSTFLEASRYRALERFYKELEENAAFSTLSQYDRDLFKNFGLLAIQQEADKETFMKYLLAGLNKNTNGENGKGVNRLLDISAEDVDFKKIYDLSQKDILKGQIDEFCAYRAPVYLLDEALDIEAALKSFLGQLEGAIPFLNIFKTIMDQGMGIVDLFIALDEYKESSRVLQESNNEYEKSIEKYNTAVVNRDTYVDDADEEHPVDTKKLETLNEEIESCAENVRSTIDSLQGSLSVFYEKYTAFFNAYETLQGGHMEVALAGAKIGAEGMEETQKRQVMKTIAAMESAYRDSKKTCEKLSAQMREVKKNDILRSQQNLTTQYEGLNKAGEELDEIDQVEMEKGSIFWDLITLIISTGEAIVEIVKKIAEALSILGEALRVLKIAITLATYDPEYNNTVTVDLGGNLKAGQEGAYREEDRERKDNQIRETDRVSRSLGFDTDIFTERNEAPGNYTLQNAMSDATDALVTFMADMEELNTSGSFLISSMLMRIASMITCVLTLITALVKLATVAATALASGNIMDVIGGKTSAAVYANTMFSNRATGISGEKRLNGSSFQSYAATPWFGADDGACFDMANTEYVIAGSRSEIANQKTVFNLMLAIRAFCNLPAVLGNDLIMRVIEALGGTGILIPVAIAIFFVILLIEAYLDMIFILYTKEGVEFIKRKGYLDFTETTEIRGYFMQIREVMINIKTKQEAFYSESVSGGIGFESRIEVGFSEEFNKRFGEFMKHTRPKEKEDDKKEMEKKKIDLDKWKEEYKEGLTKADYSNHLFILLLLLTSEDKIYSRCADLITMQMNQIRKLHGDREEFRLEEMATCLRVESTAYYTPLLPIPSMPGWNGKGLPMKSVHYSSY